MSLVSFAQLRRIVIAIDPAVTAHEDSDLTGIVVVARGPHVVDPHAAVRCELEHCPGHGFVLDDLTCRLKPTGWAKRAIAAYHHWNADRIVAEVNQGQDLVEATLRAVEVGIPYTGIGAYQGKRLRAEPASALYEQGRVHHLGVFPELEGELTTWTPDADKSPDRLDALVHGLKFLGLIGSQGQAFMTAWKTEQVGSVPRTAPELEALPRLGAQEDVSGLREGCKHHWFAGQCVHCGGPLPQGS